MKSFPGSYSVTRKEVSRLKQKEFIYSGESIPNGKTQLSQEFLENLRNSILYALERQNLLNTAQISQCLHPVPEHMDRSV